MDTRAHKRFTRFQAGFKYNRNPVQLEPRKRSSAKIGTIQRRLAWPLRKDDTHKSRMYHFLFDFCLISVSFANIVYVNMLKLLTDRQTDRPKMKKKQSYADAAGKQKLCLFFKFPDENYGICNLLQNKKSSHRGTRTHDHKIKSLALYQLS